MLTPYDLLVGLTLLHDRNQQQDAVISGWNGVLVQVADKYLLVEKKTLKEIVSPSKIAKVIDHRSWLVGLTSYEGAIIPLIELSVLIDENNATMGLDDRSVLIISLQGNYIGILVDRVLGSRNYWSDDAELSSFKSNGQGCCKISFIYKNRKIEVLEEERLAVAVGINREVASITDH